MKIRYEPDSLEEDPIEQRWERENMIFLGDHHDIEVPGTGQNWEHFKKAQNAMKSRNIVKGGSSPKSNQKRAADMRDNLAKQELARSLGAISAVVAFKKAGEEAPKKKVRRESSSPMDIRMMRERRRMDKISAIKFSKI